MGKKNSSKGPTTTDALGNTVLVAELQAQKAAEEERKAARARREAKAAAAAVAAERASGEGAGDAGGGAAGPAGVGIVSLEDTLRALQLKVADGGKLNGKEKRMLAKAEKEGRLPPPLPEEGDGGNLPHKRIAAFSLPEAWARALDAVSVHVRSGGDGGEDGDAGKRSASGAVVDAVGLDVSVRGVRLLEDAELRLLPGRRYALLGANGSGKSTIVRLIATGRLKAAVNDVACVAQELDGSSEESAFDALVASDHTVARLLAEEARLCKEMEAAEVAAPGGDGGNNASAAWGEAQWATAAQRLGELGEQLEARDAYAAEGRARRILTGLGFTKAMQDAPLSTLSGGWRTRAALAQVMPTGGWASGPQRLPAARCLGPPWSMYGYTCRFAYTRAYASTPTTYVSTSYSPAELCARSYSRWNPSPPPGAAGSWPCSDASVRPLLLSLPRRCSWSRGCCSWTSRPTTWICPPPSGSPRT